MEVIKENIGACGVDEIMVREKKDTWERYE